MRGSWYKLHDKVVCADCARHLAGDLVRGEGPAPERCAVCSGRKTPRPPSRYYDYDSERHHLARRDIMGRR